LRKGKVEGENRKDKGAVPNIIITVLKKKKKGKGEERTSPCLQEREGRKGVWGRGEGEKKGKRHGSGAMVQYERKK